MKFLKHGDLLNIGLGLICALLLVLIDHQIFLHYIQVPYISGNDGSGHASIGQYYAEHIFPRTWGWIPVWFQGMPFPQFYPPLFYIVSALLSKILFFFDFNTIIKLEMLISMLSVPAAMIWLSTRLLDKPKILTKTLVGILSVFLLATYGTVSHFGFTIEAVINKGFIPQFFSLLPLIFFIGNLPQVTHKKSARLAAAFFLFCILLSNVHVVPIAVIFLSVFGLLFSYEAYITHHHSWKQFFLMLWNYASLGLLSLFAAGFWYVPLVSVYSYFTTRALIFNANDLFQTGWSYGFLLVPFVLWFALRSKQYAMNAFTLSALIVLISAHLPIQNWFPFLPVHFYRWVAFDFYVIIIWIAYLYEILLPKISSKISHRHIKFIGPTVVVGILLVVYLLNIHDIGRWNLDGFYINYDHDNAEEVLSYLGQHDLSGSTLIEQYNPVWRTGNFILDSDLGLEGVHTITHIIRESSISNLFLAPLRNTFSSTPEMASMKTFIGFDQHFLNQPISEKISRAQIMGISHILVISSQIKNELNSVPSLAHKEKDFGSWTLYDIASSSPQANSAAKILPYLPVAAITPLNFKERDIADYNYTRLTEELERENKMANITLVYPGQLKIDHIANLSNYSSLIITAYSYDDEQAALTILKNFSTTKDIVALFTDSPLSKQLARLSLTNPHIHMIPVIAKSVKFPDPIQTETQSIFALIEKDLIPVHSTSSKASLSYTSDTSIHVHIASSTQPVPVLMQVSYFPWWKRTDTQASSTIYMATPTYMLTFATSSYDMNFTPDHSVAIGYSASALALLCMLILF